MMKPSYFHIVDSTIKYKNKNGMSKQVGEGDVFARDSLHTIQDKIILLILIKNNLLMKWKKF